jgi:hypothetical protein
VVGTWSWEWLNRTGRLASARSVPGTGELGLMQRDPAPHEPRLAWLKAARKDSTRRHLDNGPVSAVPGIDVRDAVVTDVHVDHDAVEGAEARHGGP